MLRKDIDNGMTPSQARIRVLHVVDTLAMGGAERTAFEIVTHLDQTRFDPVVLATRGPGAFDEQVRAKGIPVHTLNRRGRFDLQGLAAFLQFVQKGRFDVIHGHKFGSNALIRLAAPFISRTVIITHEQTPMRVGSLEARVNMLLAPWTDRMVCCGHDTYQSVLVTLPRYRDRLQTIPNSVDTHRFVASAEKRASMRAALGLAPEAIVGICVGRLRPEKGHDVLLQAWQLVCQRLEGQHLGVDLPPLVLVGDGERAEMLRGLAHTLGIQDMVHFLGARQDIPNLLTAADLAVSASHYEGIPLALLEAMAAGLPIVATNVGGVGEAVRDGQGGRLVPASNPPALAEGILALINDPALRQQWGALNQAHVQAHFSVDAMVVQCEQLYGTLLAARNQ